MSNKLLKIKNEIIKIVKCSSVGIINCVLDYSLFVVFTQFVKMPPTPSQFICHVAVLINGYIMHKNLVFKQDKKYRNIQFVLYITLNIANIFAGIYLLNYLNKILKMATLFAKIPVMAFNGASNYLMSRFIIFSQPVNIKIYMFIHRCILSENKKDIKQ